MPLFIRQTRRLETIVDDANDVISVESAEVMGLKWLKMEYESARETLGRWGERVIEECSSEKLMDL